jgi:NAD(P)H-dependent FMN reductase
MTRLLALSGSQRQTSTNRALLMAFADAAPEGVVVTVSNRLVHLPIFTPDLEGDKRPSQVLGFAADIRQADGLIIACPEYAHGIPGGFKNALDWLVSRDELPGKPVLLVHASHRGEFVLSHLQEVLKTISVRQLPGEILTVPLLGKTPDEVASILADDRVRAAIRTEIARFLAWIANVG